MPVLLLRVNRGLGSALDPVLRGMGLLHAALGIGLRICRRLLGLLPDGRLRGLGLLWNIGLCLRGRSRCVSTCLYISLRGRLFGGTRLLGQSLRLFRLY